VAEIAQRAATEANTCK